MTDNVSIHAEDSEVLSVQIAYSCLQDMSISWTAKGILLYFLSKSPHNAMNIYDFMTASPTDTPHDINDAIEELVHHGYLNCLSSYEPTDITLRYTIAKRKV